MPAEKYLQMAQKHVLTKFSLYEQLAHLAVQKAPEQVPGKAAEPADKG